MPATQAVQVRSSTTEGAMPLLPSPMGHVDQGAHEDWAALVVKVPVAQSSHVWSELAVAATATYLPAAHAALTAVQAAPLSAVE